MPQEDKFKKEIDRLARALAKILDDLTGAKTPAALEQAMYDTASVFKNELDMDTETLARISVKDWPAFIQSKNLSYEQLNALSAVLYALAEKEHPQRLFLYPKALWLMEHLNRTGHTWSMERDLKINRMKKILRID